MNCTHSTIDHMDDAIDRHHGISNVWVSKSGVAAKSLHPETNPSARTMCW